MDIIRKEKADIVILQVKLSRATLKEADEFKKFLLNDINSGKKKILVDLSPCEFIDSTFLGALVISQKKISEYGGYIKLVAAHSAVRSMFELTRINKVFETFLSVDEALKSFA